ncbi:MAG TPA: ABC transporter ATP-binding protein [Gaiellaceae bacterium]
MTERAPLVELQGCTKVYRVGSFGSGRLTAVRDVAFDLNVGEIVSLIGESGSGKSTIGRMILRLSPVTSGSIRFRGADVAHFQGRELKEYHRHAQGVFQDPFSSYNPIYKADRVFKLVKDAYFPSVGSREWAGRVEGALDAVSLDPAQVLHRYPHQLSGGQLQRLLVARALLLDIDVLVADEIISMLDASTRIDVLNLLGGLRERGLGILFITHDLSLGNYISDRTLILRRGEIVEMGETESVFGNPQHAYTRMLLASVPQIRHKWEERDDSPAAELEATLDGADTALVEIEGAHLVRKVVAR